MAMSEWWTRLFASIDGKRAGAFAEHLVDDAVFRYGSGPEVQGRDAIASFVEQVFASFHACAHDVHDSWDVESARICRGFVTYTRHDGKRVTLPFCNVLTMRGELVERYQIYIDPAPLFAQ